MENEIKVVITGEKLVFNKWTLATATVNGKEFQIQMVRFDKPSRYGIRKGRISKLWASNGSDGINYDRGWDVRPWSAAGKALLAEILKRYN